MADMLIILKTIYPTLLNTVSGLTAAVTVIVLFSLRNSKKDQDKRFENIERRLNALTRIHCAKYPRHTIAFLDGANGAQLRDVIDSIHDERYEDE